MYAVSSVSFFGAFAGEVTHDVSVVDDYDSFIGIVTRRDIMRHLTGKGPERRS